MHRPTAIYSAAQVRALDAWEIEKRRVPGFTLMTRAAESALKILGALAQAKRVAVVCSAGNNGGDGYVLARLARAAGLDAMVWPPHPQTSSAVMRAARRREWLATGGSAHPFAADALSGGDVIVDALLGIGLTGAPRPRHGGNPRHQCSETPRAGARHSLRGECRQWRSARGRGARRDHVDLRGVQIGLFVGPGAEHAGVVLLDDLGVVAPVLAKFAPLMRRIDEGEITATLPKRPRESRKEVPTAACSSWAVVPACRARCAWRARRRCVWARAQVKVAGATENLVAVTATRPELIYLPVSSAGSLDEAMRGADDARHRAWPRDQRLGPAPVVGRVGGGRADGSRRRRVESPGAESGEVVGELGDHSASGRSRQIVRDRHRGSAGRPTRRGARLHSRFGAVTVLKGAGTLVAWGEAGAAEIDICERGNPGMATAGMGDVLTGVIAGLRAQSGDSGQAARIGVLVHSLAGELMGGKLATRRPFRAPHHSASMAALVIRDSC
jgi:NAD(P)H-hydrate epimerase